MSRRRGLLAALFILLVAFVSAADEQARSPQELLAAAEAAHQEGRLEEALALYEQAGPAAKGETRVWIELGRGRTLLDLNRADEAAEIAYDLQETPRLGTGQKIATLHLLGVALLARDATPERGEDDLRHAEGALREVLRVTEGEWIEPRLDLALLLVRKGESREAMEEAKKLLDASEEQTETTDWARILYCSLAAAELESRTPIGELRAQARSATSDRGLTALPLIEPIHREDPPYPAALQLAAVEGEVVVEQLVDRRGCVREAKPVAGRRDLAQAALPAVEQWVYRPLVQDGEAVPALTTSKLAFRLR